MVSRAYNWIHDSYVTYTSASKADREQITALQKKIESELEAIQGSWLSFFSPTLYTWLNPDIVKALEEDVAALNGFLNKQVFSQQAQIEIRSFLTKVNEKIKIFSHVMPEIPINPNAKQMNLDYKAQCEKEANEAKKHGNGAYEIIYPEDSVVQKMTSAVSRTFRLSREIPVSFQKEREAFINAVKILIDLSEESPSSKKTEAKTRYENAKAAYSKALLDFMRPRAGDTVELTIEKEKQLDQELKRVVDANGLNNELSEFSADDFRLGRKGFNFSDECLSRATDETTVGVLLAQDLHLSISEPLIENVDKTAIQARDAVVDALILKYEDIEEVLNAYANLLSILPHSHWRSAQEAKAAILNAAKISLGNNHATAEFAAIFQRTVNADELACQILDSYLDVNNRYLGYITQQKRELERGALKQRTDAQRQLKEEGRDISHQLLDRHLAEEARRNLLAAQNQNRHNMAAVKTEIAQLNAQKDKLVAQIQRLKEQGQQLQAQKDFVTKPATKDTDNARALRNALIALAQKNLKFLKKTCNY